MSHPPLPLCVQLVMAQQHALIRYLHRSYPNLCPGRVEDAVAEMYLLLCRSPARFEAALANGGPRHLLSLARQVARYALKDQIRRAAYHHEEGAALGDPQGVRSPGQELWASLPRDLDGAVLAVCERVSPRHAQALRGALMDKLNDGADDTALAARHRVRREFVNRAWHALAHELLRR